VHAEGRRACRIPQIVDMTRSQALTHAGSKSQCRKRAATDKVRRHLAELTRHDLVGAARIAVVVQPDVGRRSPGDDPRFHRLASKQPDVATPVDESGGWAIDRDLVADLPNEAEELRLRETLTSRRGMEKPGEMIRIDRRRVLVIS
jgi:hypothetical protein